MGYAAEGVCCRRVTKEYASGESPVLALRGIDLASQQEIPLRFVRLEPYIVPKTSLTGSNTERVDTRVVQVIYAIDRDSALVRDQKVLVGQLLDVFIDIRPNGSPR